MCVVLVLSPALLTYSPSSTLLPECYFTEANLSDSVLNSQVAPHPLSDILTLRARHSSPLPGLCSRILLSVIINCLVLLSLNDFHSMVSCLCAFTKAIPSSWHAFPHTYLANCCLFFRAQQKSLPGAVFHKPCCHLEILPVFSQSTMFCSQLYHNICCTAPKY